MRFWHRVRRLLIRSRRPTTLVQRYVSDELSHFVGNKTKSQTEDEQYDVLVNKILNPGWLTYPPHDPTKPRSVALNLSKPISTDDLIGYQVVCFCDIPEFDLAIHTNKYGRFGLSFKKEFLIDRGACPVFYVAKESPIPEREIFGLEDFKPRIDEAMKLGWLKRELYFDTSARALLDILAALDAICCNEDERYFKGASADVFKERLGVLLGLSNGQVASVEAIIKGQQAAKTVRMSTNFLINYIFTNMKCFDAKRQPHDAENYYMEREWRIGNNVKFSLGDVARVFLPQRYAKRFREDLPAYTGQISFMN
jgi:Putative abortive phage resistance protein AbiGi, antitoxin